MKTEQNNRKTPQEIASMFYAFAHQRPGLNFADYGDVKIYRRESTEITKDLHDFRELFSLASLCVSDFAEKLTKELKETSGRLTLDGDRLQYIAGQYFPTEYRPAACRVLVNLMWKNHVNNYRTETGKQIRAYFKKRLSRRVYKNYFA